MNWFTRLFKPKTLVGTQVHAWTYTPWGRARIVGEVVEETPTQITIDPSRPAAQEFRAFVTVWRHDMRLLHEPLPADTTVLTHEIGT